MTTLSVHLTVDTPLARTARALLARYLWERRGVRLVDGDAHADITLDICPGIGTEGFRIADAGGGVRLSGHDERGLIYAVGKYLRDPRWRGVSVPEKPFRAIYFATHFHNYYHDGPLDDIRRYVEELALWGCNALCVWFDMHHYHGMDDPEAQAMVARLRAILQAAEGVGMTPALCMLANEAFADSPAELRSDFRFGDNGYTADIGAYGVELCPHKPGGLAQILDYRRQMLEAFRGINIGCVSMGAYDQGGCTCTDCFPWGCHGFLDTAEAVAGVVRDIFPAARVLLATWYFDKCTSGEWSGMAQRFAETPPAWLDGLVIDNAGNFPDYPLQHGVPGGLPAVGFPEISMMPMWPWGGFGANPRPLYWQHYWNGVRDLLAGGMAYSEGIYEDLNKVFHLQHCWESARRTREIALEYAASEFTPACADDALFLMLELEDAIDHGVNNDAVLSVLQCGGWAHCGEHLPHVYLYKRLKHTETARGLAQKIDAQLAPVARAGWRWRLLWLRAMLDDALARSHGRPTAESETYFAELTRIYHADQAEWVVAPPGTPVLTRVFSTAATIAALPDTPRGPQYAPFITHWQVSRLLPKTVAGATPVSLTDPLDWQPFAALANARGFVNLHSLFADDDGLAYLGTRLHVAEAGTWRLHVGHDGGIRAFVDGQPVITAPERRNPAPVFRSQAEVVLAAGEHELLLAFDPDAGRAWGLCCFFEALEGDKFPEPVAKTGE